MLKPLRYHRKCHHSSPYAQKAERISYQANTQHKGSAYTLQKKQLQNKRNLCLRRIQRGRNSPSKFRLQSCIPPLVSWFVEAPVNLQQPPCSSTVCSTSAWNKMQLEPHNTLFCNLKFHQKSNTKEWHLIWAHLLYCPVMERLFPTPPARHVRGDTVQNLMRIWRKEAKCLCDLRVRYFFSCQVNFEHLFIFSS